MDRLFVNGEKYRFDDAQTGLVVTVKAENDTLVLQRAETEAGDAVQPTAEQRAALEASAAAMIRAGELRPLHEDER